MTRPHHPRIDLPSGELAYVHERGQRTTVMLLHGNSSCGKVFEQQFDSLRLAGHGLLVPDLPGHGASAIATDPASTYSFPGYAKAIRGLIDALAIPEVHVVGWSLGGHISMELALVDPRVRSALVTGAPPLKPSQQALETAFLPTSTMALAGKAEFSDDDALAYAAAMLGGPERVTPELLLAARRADGAARRWMIHNGVAGQGEDETSLLHDAPCPVGIVQGVRDPFLSMAYLRGLPTSGLWRGDVQWLDAGHAPHWEAPATFNALMLAFLSDVEI